MSDIIAGDKNGDGVAVGDIVKVSHRKELYKIHKIIEVDDGNNGEPYPVFELAPLQPVTIFRGEHQIELLDDPDFIRRYQNAYNGINEDEE